MKVTRHMANAAVMGALVLTVWISAMQQAEAAFVVTLEQVGNDVVLTGSGSIDTADLKTISGANEKAFLDPTDAGVGLGPTGFTPVMSFGNVSGPASFGSGSNAVPSSGSGDAVGLEAHGINIVSVPADYASGAPLADAATFVNATFASLGVTPGVYIWNLRNNGSTFDTFTLQVGTVPEPASGLLLGLPIMAVLFLRRRFGRIM